MARVLAGLLMLVASVAVEVHGLAAFDRINQEGTAPSSEKRPRQAVRKLIATTVLEPPYMMLKTGGLFLAGNERFEGYLADMLARLAANLGFDYEIRLVKDGKYGNPGANGSWDGMIGELLRGEADIAAAPLTITPDRKSAVDFSMPFMTFRATALLRKPKRRKIKIRTADDLLKSNMAYGIEQNSITFNIFGQAKNATYRQMWTRMATFLPPAFVHSTQEGIERVRRKKYAFILDSPTAEYIATRAPCQYYTIEPFLDLQEYAFAVKKGEKLLESLNIEMANLQASQEMQMMYLKWWRQECTKKEKTTAKPRDERDGEDAAAYESTTEPNPWRYATAAGFGVTDSGATCVGSHKLFCIVLVLVIHLYRYY